MGGGKGSADSSGMYQALASAQAANQAYQLGQQNLQWAQTQWSAEYPYEQQIAQQQIATQAQTSDFSRNQQEFYEQQYQPMEAALNKQVQQWATPQNVALQAGQASANVAESINAQKTAEQTQLEGYGVNPGSTRFASLGAAMGVQGGAAEAGAGTQAAIQTRLQGMQMMGSAVNTGRGFPSAVASLSGAGSQAGAAGSQGITSNLQTGSSMMTAPANWYNAGANNMGVYVNAVNGYNQAQVGFAQANAMEMAGFGSALGGMFGMFGGKMFMEEGGPVEKFQDGGTVDPMNTGFNPNLPGSEGVGGGFAQGLHASEVSMHNARMANMMRNLPRPASAQPSTTAYNTGGVIPGRYFQAGPAAQQPQPQQQQPMQQPVPPQNGTPGGIITPQMSPSKGQVPDDVDAKLTVGEFVMPLDVVRWKGKEYFYRQIDSARKQEMVANSRGDIGGEPTTALPSRNPQFVSRPNAMPGAPGAIPARAA